MSVEPIFLRPAPTPQTFSEMVRALRIRAGLSQKALARRAQIDPAYINRIERSPSVPSRAVVLAIWQAVDGGTDDRERLLVAAGHCPEVIVRAGGWDAYRNQFRARMDEAVLALDAAFSLDRVE